MQLIAFASAAAVVLATTASAEDGKMTTNQLMAAYKQNPTSAYAKIVNRCPYDVYIWSVLKNAGCDSGNMMVLKKGGGVYQENLRPAIGGIGTSIKISKTQQCKGVDITQLEYYLETEKKGYEGNYLDVSYVDCLGGECPTMNEGFYLKAGDQSTKATSASAGNTVCPILSCTDRASCSKVAYVLPDDIQTRSCPTDQPMEYYMCGGEAPSSNDNSPPVDSPKPELPKPATPSSVKPVSSAAVYKANVAAVTQAPEIKEPIKTPKVKTNVVYVTEYKYINAKRHEHAHAHARRHQNFHA